MDISPESLMNLERPHHLTTDDPTQLVALRQFNTSLLEQIADFRKGDVERTQLQKALTDQQTQFRQTKEDLARKLSVLSDENWAKALELQSLEELRKKDVQGLHALKEQLTEAQTRIEEMTWQSTQNIETFRSFEHQATGEIDRLRAESNDLRRQLDALGADNNKLRQLLNIRDTQSEERHENLSIWQKQLTELDQHLVHTDGSLKQERTNLLHVALQLENAIRLTAGHPFKDYLEVTERELTRLSGQLTSVSAISPLRPKIEERLQQLKQQADAMKSGLVLLDQKQNERLSAVAAVSKALKSLPEFSPATDVPVSL